MQYSCLFFILIILSLVQGHEHGHKHSDNSHDHKLADTRGAHGHDHDHNHHHHSEENLRSVNNVDSGIPDTESINGGRETQNVSSPTPMVSLTKKWMYAILAALVVSSTSLVGLFFLWIKKDILCKLMDHVTSFAVGTLLATVVFHVYPEAQEYLADHEIDWICHGLFIAGIIIALAMEQTLHLVVHAFGGVHLHGHDLANEAMCGPVCDNTTAAPSTSILPTVACDHGHTHVHGDHHSHHHHHSKHETEQHHHEIEHDHDHEHDCAQSPHSAHDYHRHASTGTCMVSETSSTSDVKKPKFLSRETVKAIKPVALVVALGDFFHSFIDGILIAIAFQLCEQQVGWLVTSAVVLHEIPHRVGDFFVFLKAGICPRNAVYLNLGASLSSVLGVILLLRIREVSNHTLGYMLSFASGMLLFIALSELLPSVMHSLNLRTLLINLFCMIAGVILIKIVLTDHVHCGVSTGHDHAHHDHGHHHDHHH